MLNKKKLKYMAKESLHRKKYRLRCSCRDKKTNICTVSNTLCLQKCSCERMKIYDTKNENYYESRN